MRNNLEKIDLKISDNQVAQFEKYYEILVSWNEFMNLTGITEHEEVWLKHYVDSLWIYNLEEFREKIGGRMIDVGTGAGFPGLPLKIAFPQMRVTLLDSLNKRINFLNEVILQTNLQDVETCHGRAEDFAKKKEYREQYDICVSRAVSNLATLSEYCLPFVKNQGIFVAYKSGNIDEELQSSNNAVKLLGGDVERVFKTTLPDSDIERSFVVIRKIKQTPMKYPRKAGLPSKEPLT